MERDPRRRNKSEIRKGVEINFGIAEGRKVNFDLKNRAGAGIGGDEGDVLAGKGAQAQARIGTGRAGMDCDGLDA
jgi:hypothetical protein